MSKQDLPAKERDGFEARLVEQDALLRSLRDEVVSLRNELVKVQEALARLAAGLAVDPVHLRAVEAERDAYRKSLYALTRQGFEIREEEFSPSPEGGPTLQQFIEQLDARSGG
jgi:hypothetical protein